MRVSLHDKASNNLIELSKSLDLTPSQVVTLLSTSFNNHINKGQPLELQGVIYERKEKE